MKFKTALAYRMSYAIRAMLIFFCYYLVFAVLFPILGLIATGMSNIIYSDAAGSAIVFIFVIAFIGTASDFKLLIQNGVARQTIFLTNLAANAILSLAFSFFVVTVVSVVNLPLVESLRLQVTLINLYTENQFVMTWLLLALVLFFSSMLGFLAGTFNSRVKGFLKIMILLLLIMIPSFFVTLMRLFDRDFLTHLYNFFAKIIGFAHGGFHSGPLVLTICVISAILILLNYLMNRRREIATGNQSI